MRADRIVAAAIAAGAAVLTAQLLLPPIVGLADNGDFSKVMRPAGLAYVEPEPARYFRWASSKFAFAAPRPDPDGYRTSETVLARSATAASGLVGASLFDIRALGALHAALLLLVSRSALRRPGISPRPPDGPQQSCSFWSSPTSPTRRL